MNNKKILVLVLFLSLFYFKAHAEGICTKNGYTVITINGIFTDNVGARNNKENLKNQLPPTYNNEPVIVDYVYNPTHLAGFGDLVDTARQGLFEPKSDYDLVEMLSDASQKVKTQKLLLVGHSQGNFYINNFYDKVASIEGGVPRESIGVYSVATPDSRVAGGGKYLTSDTDSVIAGTVSLLKKIMTPNTHIALQKEDGNGHSFSDVYLKYRSKEIISDIKSSLGELKTNLVQDENVQCISPVKLSLLHKTTGAILAITDAVAGIEVKTAVLEYKIAKSTAIVVGNTTVKVATFVYNTTVNTAIAVGNAVGSATKFVVNTGAKVASYAYNSIANIFSTSRVNNLASIGFLELQDTPETTIENGTDNNTQNVLAAETQPDIDLNTIDNIPTDTIPVTIISEEINIENVVTPDLNTPLVTPVLDPIVGANNGGGGAGGGENIPAEITPDVITPATDKTAPVITIIGENKIDIYINGEYVEQGATAFDGIDGEIIVVNSGEIDTKTAGVYTITYTATDLAGNTATLTRTINVLPNPPVASKVATLSFPTSGFQVNDGLVPNRGIQKFTLFKFQIMYTDAENNPPQDVKLYVKNSETQVALSELSMKHEAEVADAFSDNNYINGELYTISSFYDLGDYSYSFIAHDKNGDFTKIEENSALIFSAVPSTYTYIPKFTFGKNNGDGNDWQAWAFNGSNVFDWMDTYVNNYLHEQFKIQTYTGYYCSLCLERGIFNHDPQLGFESEDLYTSPLDANPQNNMDGKIYNIDIQWDSTGYTYYVYHDSVVDSTGHTNVKNMSNDMWVGWDGSYNNFKTFPSGAWLGVVPYSVPIERTGGYYMVLQPYPVYDPTAVQVTNPDPIPKSSSEKSIISLSFDNLNPKVNGIIDNDNKTIKLTVPYGTSITAICPTIVTSEKSSVLPYRYMDFTNPATYTVTAQDGSTSSYVVTVIVSPNPNPPADPILSSLKLISSFNFEGLNPKVDGLIDNENKTIKLTVPYSTPVIALVPAIVISEKSSILPANNIAQDFTIPVTYTVKAEDNSVSEYTVSVIVLSNPNPPSEPDKSSLKSIISFDFKNLEPIVNGNIDSDNKTIKLTIPYGTSVNALIPTIVTSEKSSILPTNNSAQDYTTPVTYTVTAEDGSTLSYVVTVSISPDPDINKEPIISSYTLNGNQSDITINPLVNDLSIILNSNKNVNWMYIKIEKESDHSVEKHFQSGGECVDGTKVCSKIWDGLLSSRELLNSGNYDGIYKIKVHIKDNLNQEFYDYLPSVITVNTQM